MSFTRILLYTVRQYVISQISQSSQLRLRSLLRSWLNSLLPIRGKGSLRGRENIYCPSVRLSVRPSVCHAWSSIWCAKRTMYGASVRCMEIHSFFNETSFAVKLCQNTCNNIKNRNLSLHFNVFTSKFDILMK